nr:MAG TPA: hypothetical protein [Crassvirales sp.]DAR56541.1 MAG TPA: hypothetical protein [Crassvirales sp.]
MEFFSFSKFGQQSRTSVVKNCLPRFAPMREIGLRLPLSAFCTFTLIVVAILLILFDIVIDLTNDKLLHICHSHVLTFRLLKKNALLRRVA